MSSVGRGLGWGAGVVSVAFLALTALVIGGEMIPDFAWSWKLRSVTPPWQRGQTAILDHVNEHWEPGQHGLTEGGAVLPDEEPASDESPVRWAAGAEDGVFGHHFGRAEVEEVVEAEVQALRAVLAWPSRARIERLYGLLLEHPALSTVDPLLERIVEEARAGGLPEDRFRELALWLVGRAPDREPVKMAVAWLGLLGHSEDRPVFLLLGRHEEFTLFATVALLNLEGDSQRDLLELARNVDGWGRIHLVERFAGSTDPEIRRWLLRDGYRNSVMNEYTAYIAAATGGLLEELRQSEQDEELLVGAGEILSALISGEGGPAEGIGDYEDGPAATEHYLEFLRTGEGRELAHVLAVETIRRFIEAGNEVGAGSGKPGWPTGLRESLRKRCEEILAQPRWRELVQERLMQVEPETHWQTSQAAEILGIDAWSAHLDLIASGSMNFTAWYGAAATDDAGRMERLTELAKTVLDVEELGSGPGESLGYGPYHARYMAHEQLVRQLARFPGLGWTWVEAGLRSPVIRIRHAAVQALEAWGREAWPQGTARKLDQAISREPRDDVRQALERVRGLGGETE